MTRLAYLCTLWLLLSGFASSPKQELDPKKLYRQDIDLVVNGVRGDGVMVVPQADKYQISGVAKGTLDLLTITTCHRDISWSPGKKEFVYEYVPRRSIEGSRACPILIGGYDKKGQHSWGIIEQENKDLFQMEAFLACNGSGKRFSGVSICQSRAGLIQVIEFDSPVKYSPDPSCPLPAPIEDGKRFEFPIVRGTCVYAFKDMASDKYHRLLTYGYESVLLREE